MFNEVKLRESIKFSFRNLEFEGLVEFCEFTPKGHEQKYVDTGLVFMYRPILGNWVQAIQANNCVVKVVDEANDCAWNIWHLGRWLGL